MSFWLDKPETKKGYLVTHIKRTQHKYQIRDVQISHLLTLSEELLMDNFIEYFDTLPSNYRKAFKSAWRQRAHKLNSSNSKRVVELTDSAHTKLHVLLELFKTHDSDFNYSELSKQNQIEYILDKSCDLILESGLEKRVTK